MKALLSFFQKNIHERPLWQWLLFSSGFALSFWLFALWGAYDGEPASIAHAAGDISHVEDEAIPEAQGVFTVKSLFEYQEVALEHYQGKYIELAGIVKELDTVENYVALVDENDPNGEMIICHTKAFVDDVIAGDLAVATGILTETKSGGIELQDTYIKVRKTVDELEDEREEKAEKKKDKKTPRKEVVPKPSRSRTGPVSSGTSQNNNHTSSGGENNTSGGNNSTPTTPPAAQTPGNYTYNGNGLSIYVPKGYAEAGGGSFTNANTGANFTISTEGHQGLPIAEMVAQEAESMGISSESIQLTDRGYRYSYPANNGQMTVEVIYANNSLARLVWQVPAGVDAQADINESLQSFQFIG